MFWSMNGASVLHSVLGVSLLVVGLLTILAPKRRHRSPHPTIGRVYFVLLAGTLGSGMVVGARDPAISPFEIVTPPTFLLGLVGILAARRRRPWLGRPWLEWHIVGQGGSYIGVVTAALFQVVPRLVEPSPLLSVLLGVVPSVIGTVLIRRAVSRRKPRTGAEVRGARA
jgi:hypothetical protein